MNTHSTILNDASAEPTTPDRILGKNTWTLPGFRKKSQHHLQQRRPRH